MNPRFAGTCLVCGKAMPIQRKRDPDFEATFIREVGGMGIEPFRVSRAGSDPVRDFSSRDFVLEMREELADYLNYCVWAAERAQEAGNDVSPLFNAARHVVEAYRLTSEFAQ